MGIDEGIADLIAALWQRGIRTEQSCEENTPGVVWIAFPSTSDALSFLDVIGVNEAAVDALNDDDSDSLVTRAIDVELACPGDGPPIGWEWRWSGQPRVDQGTFGMAVNFPRDDLRELQDRLGI